MEQFKIFNTAEEAAGEMGKTPIVYMYYEENDHKLLYGNTDLGEDINISIEDCLSSNNGIKIVAKTSIPNNEIWYTTSNNAVLSPMTSNKTILKEMGLLTNTYENGIGKLVFSNDLTSINNNAFKTCTKLVSVIIPNSVTKIGDSVFSGCTSLTSITIPDSVTEIGSSAFSGCTELTSINISNEDVIKIGGNAFENTSWYNNQPDGIIYIGNNFYGIKGDKSIYTEINIKEGTKYICSYSLSSCTELTSVIIPDSVTEIGWNAFKGCTGLTSINIPNSVTEIESGAFSDCTGLTSIEIPNSVTKIGRSAFYGCTGLTSVIISNSVTEIDYYTFSGCTGLTSIEIPNSITTIKLGVFQGCNNSELVLRVPSSVTEIGGSAFNGVKKVVYNGAATGSPWGAVEVVTEE